MLKIELKNVVKYFQDRLILNIGDLRIYDQEVVGIVGLNGSGKTTLLNIIAGRIKPDQGIVKMYGDYSYITQFDKTGIQIAQIDKRLAGRFKLPEADEAFMSGGERTRLKIAAVFSKGSEIIFADEPTANLDLNGIQLFEETVKQFSGTMLIVAHDRELLDKLCNRILEIEHGQVRLYNGNYSSYVDQKERERTRQEFEYQQFVKERARLKDALVELHDKSGSVKKTPKRMGNSEARLHKMGNQRAKANLDRVANAIKSRIESLETKERPQQYASMKLDLRAPEKVHSKVIIEGKDLNKAFGQKTIFSNASFQLRNGEKTAIIGENGSGKTTLIKMIMNGEEGIKTFKQLKIGYFDQDVDGLDHQKTIIENLMGDSIYDEATTRTILARLLFKRDDIYKKVAVLSGGERVRVSLGKIVLSDFNLMILDEPTNYLDIYSMEAVEEVLSEYTGNLLFVSHDRRFINKIASNILLVQDKALSTFEGNYEQFLKRESQRDKEQGQDQKMLLEYRLSEIIGRLAAPAKHDDIELLDKEYKSILAKLKELC